MKKISAVLLVMVLVGSVVFAGFSGSVSTEFGLDLDGQTYGFTNNAEKLSLDVNFVDLVGEAKGEGDIYADIAASVTLSFDTADDNVADSTFATQVIADFAFDHANIVGDNWSVGITGSANAADWAVSSIDSTDKAEANNVLGYSVDDSTDSWTLRAKDFLVETAGIEAMYADYSVTVGLFGDYGADTLSVYGAVKTPDFELGDGLTAALAAAGGSDAGNKTAAGSVKVAYADDTMSADVAADVVYDGGIMADVAASFAYDMVSVDAYFATDAYVNGGATGDTNYLSAKAVVDLDPLSVTLKGKDILDAQKLYADVAYDVSEELSVAAGVGYTISTSAWDVSGEATYTAADYTLAASVDYFSDSTIAVNASIASTTLVDGATLKLAYEYDTNDADNASGTDNAVIASVKIAF